MRAPAASSCSLAARGLCASRRAHRVAMCRANGNTAITKTKRGGQSRPGCRRSAPRKPDLAVVASSSNGLHLKRKQTEWTTTHAASVDGGPAGDSGGCGRRGRRRDKTTAVARVVGDRQMAIAITDSPSHPANRRPSSCATVVNN